MAMAIYGAGGGQYVEDTGAVNAYVIDPVSPKEAAPAYFDGLTLSFKPGTANTTAATVNYNSLGVKSITDLDGNALVGGEITGSVTIRYNSTDDRFEIVKPAMVTLDAISGLVTQNGTDSDHDIDIQVGEAMDSTNGYLLRLTSVMTKQIDATWAAGSNAGGLFTGTVAADTTYFIFLIRKDSDGSIDAGFDTSETAANIPGGYTAFRMIDALITDSSANIINWYAESISNRAIFKEYSASILDLNLSGSLPIVKTLLTLTVPHYSAIVAHVNLTLSASDAVNNVNVWVRSSNFTDAATTNLNRSIVVNRVTTGDDVSNNVNEFILTDSSGQIAYRANVASSGIIFNIITFGYTIYR